MSVLREPIKVVADILQHELELAAGQVMIADQKAIIPQNPGLYISLEYLGPSKVLANTNHFDPVSNKEIQTATAFSLIQIDLMSFDSSARLRREEVAMALASVYSQQQQEKYQCQIARNPGVFNDASSVESMAMLKRYTTTISVTALFSKEKSVEYYERFENPEVKINE